MVCQLFKGEIREMTNEVLVEMIIYQKRKITIEDWFYFFIKEIKCVLKGKFKFNGIKKRFPKLGGVSQAQMAEIHEYLANKYGIQI